jgi:hypothetical protein
MTEDQVKAIFLLANVEYKALIQTENEYWPKAYVEEIKSDPWWLVATDFGIVKIGWRKRVINIDWSDTKMRLRSTFSYDDFEFWERGLTQDDVTKWETGIHAYGYGKAIDYLRELEVRSRQWTYAHSEEGKIDLAERKVKKLAESTKGE